MLSLILLVTAGLATSTTAVLGRRWSAGRGGRGPNSDGNIPLQISAGILALGAVLLAVNVQLGAFS